MSSIGQTLSAGRIHSWGSDAGSTIVEGVLERFSDQIIGVTARWALGRRFMARRRESEGTHGTHDPRGPRTHESAVPSPGRTAAGEGDSVAPSTRNEVPVDKDKQDDLNKNGIDDEIEPPFVDVTASSKQLADRIQNNQGTDPTLSGGDIDARWEDAESGGDETVGGSTATPGRNDLDAIGKAIGVTYADGEELKVGEKEERRDKHRWELDPASSEDYADRTKEGK